MKCVCGYSAKSKDEATVHELVCLDDLARAPHSALTKVIVCDDRGEIVLFGFADVGLAGKAHLADVRLGPGNIKTARTIRFDHPNLEPAQSRFVTQISHTQQPPPIYSWDSSVVEEITFTIRTEVTWSGAPLKLR